MQIHYQPNPLATIVELDAADIERLRAAVIIEELKERIYGAAFSLKEGERFDPVHALHELDLPGLEREPFSKTIDEIVARHVEELKDVHVGDCICVPCSCGKCHAEDLIGVRTLAGLGKHSAYKISNAFSQDCTLDEAIDRLEKYDPVPEGSWLNYPRAEFDKHVPRWRLEAKSASEWLIKYRQEHFSHPPAGAAGGS